MLLFSEIDENFKLGEFKIDQKQFAKKVGKS